MKSFLKYVAEDILRDHGTDLSNVVVVFPNKRASLFLNDELMKLTSRPIWCPTYITISDLFRRHSSFQVADPIKLICDLHKSFVECTGLDETLDHFYGWGQLLLADFDDLDKNMGDAKQIFMNLANLHELDDDSYLDEEKRNLLKKFFANFTDDHHTELKKRFVELWNKLYDIYLNFNHRLSAQGLAYEGALYRQVAENKDVVFEHDTYLFVGFNMMQTVELRLYDELKKKANCHFYWDYDKYYVDDKRDSHTLHIEGGGNAKNEAGHYISRYLSEFGNKFSESPEYDSIYGNFNLQKDITYMSAPTENIQARFVYDWLMEKTQDENGKAIHRYEAGRQVAIVLADENLLPTVIHSIPKELNSCVNITLGYPLQQTPFYSLVLQLIHLQSLGHVKGSNIYRLAYVNKVLRHPYAQFISSKNEELLRDLEEKKQFYLPSESLCLDEGLSLVFADLESSDNYNLALIANLVDILKLIGMNARQHEDPLFQESLFRTYTLMNRLLGLIKSGDLVVDTITLERLLLQLFQSTSIPFHGEPAVGVQIMGILETRNLDFRHVLVLSCNEGNLPKGVNDSSFIPYSIRKAYGLTTVDNKVAIFAYYFLRLLQRASDVTLTYNNATEDGHTGEMTRFMLQLLVESHHVIKRGSIVAEQNVELPSYDCVEKDEHIMQILNKPHLITPTYLNTFIRCSKRFYYKYIQNIQEPDEMQEEIDNCIFGNIFHRAAQFIYLKFASSSDIVYDEEGEPQLIHPIVIQKGDLDNVLKDEGLIYRIVDDAFSEELFKVKTQNAHQKYNGLQLINREVIASYLRQLLRIDKDLAPFTIIGLELKVESKFSFDTPDGKKLLRLGGFIDRLDAVAANGNSGMNNLAERIRVIDYKTGRTPSTFPRVVESLFDSKELGKHTDYYLQAMLYSLIVKHSKRYNPASDPVSPALLFIQQSGAQGYDPTLKFGKDLIWDAASYETEFMEGLQMLISKIFDPNGAFVPTDDKRRCETCPYASLCK